MKKALLLSIFLFLACLSFAQSSVKQNIAKQVNELFFSTVDSTLNEIVNVDRMGTINIMYKTKDENVDFNILDLSKIELAEPRDETPYMTLVFHCRNCMHLTSPSEERRNKFETSTISLPVKYKALALKLITKLEELQRQNR